MLLHPTSLPNSYGIGTIGKDAFKFVDFLSASGMKLWQTLPLGPTGYGDSPYASFSTFAGNPLLIDLDDLKKRGWATQKIITPPNYIKQTGNVDYGAVVYWKLPVLKKCALHFLANADAKDKRAFSSFKRQNAFWLDEYATFMSIKEFYDEKAKNEKVFGAMWNNYWQNDLATHESVAVATWKKTNVREIDVHKAIQFFFFTQWYALKDYANKKGISIIGDIPIFVARDSADVWSNQRLFQLDKNGHPLRVAGCPPDYFSKTGQLWGNPLYDWSAMEKEGYNWWISRIKATLRLVDYIRIDHFRGFEAYWSIPAKDKTAENGKWVKGPGNDLFNAIKKHLGDVPIIAEDLGVITDNVKKLRDDYNFPGMKVLQFAFSPDEAKQNGMTNPFLPHNYTRNSVVYTGTHDNDTLQGWLDKASNAEIALISKYLDGNDAVPLSRKKLCRRLVRLAISSAANFCIIPLQDFFALGNEARINHPSTTGGKNWTWRMSGDLLDKDAGKKAAKSIKEQCQLYGR